MASAVFGLGTVACDRTPQRGDSRGEYAVRCMRWRILFHSAEDLWYVMLCMMKQAAAGKSRPENQSCGIDLHALLLYSSVTHPPMTSITAMTQARVVDRFLCKHKRRLLLGACPMKGVILLRNPLPSMN
jgi:hypothetical protein